ncbi:hypothetical protein GALL_415690 [mine drainage metagenome]|uniref:Uncharacterized protein n=1 Tax=mine drainage metagenome TaxID=410659 RepID=A0A1J5PZ50_9ZZZZ
MRTTPRVAGFRSEYPAGFELECMAGFVGIRILARRGENFRHRAVVAEQIDDKRFAQGIVDPFVGKQVSYVEQVAWVLTIEGCDNLAGIEIGKGDDRHFGEAESVLNRV